MMQKHMLGLVGRGQKGKVCLFNWTAACAVLLVALGIMVRTVTSAGCGQSSISQRVVGGKNSILGKWPWQVSIVVENNHVCGGSLISRNWVVTAAHCTSNHNLSHFYVMLGMLNLTSTTRVIILVKNVIIHPIYNGDGSSGDLALMELKSPVTFTSNIQPICLPSPDQEFPDGMMCWLTGWGETAEQVKLTLPYTLQEVDLPLINYAACDHIFQATYSLTFPPNLVHDDMICAGYSKGGKDGCQGDSGGPLTCQSGHYWFLVGIVSWGDGCAEPGKPGVYTKVSNFTSWIKEHTDLDVAITFEKKVNATTIQFQAFTTQTPAEAAQNFTLAKIIHEESTGAGLRPHMSMSLLVVVLFIRILDIL